MNELEYQKRKVKEEIQELLQEIAPSFYMPSSSEDEELFVLRCLKKILKEMKK